MHRKAAGAKTGVIRWTEGEAARKGAGSLRGFHGVRTRRSSTRGSRESGGGRPWSGGHDGAAGAFQPLVTSTVPLLTSTCRWDRLTSVNPQSCLRSANANP